MKSLLITSVVMLLAWYWGIIPATSALLDKAKLEAAAAKMAGQSLSGDGAALQGMEDVILEE